MNEPMNESWMIEACQRIQGIEDLDTLEAVRLEFLGKTGIIPLSMKNMARLNPSEKKEAGVFWNQAKNAISQAIHQQKSALDALALEKKLRSEQEDLTLPIHQSLGSVHPLSHTFYEVTKILKTMGFSLAQGPHIEEDFYNFGALNIPENHPARQDQDTFYITHKGVRHVLRTHTSPVQIRSMIGEGVPLQILAPGRVFRSDYDATHTPNFHQVEGLYIGEGIHMGHLKYTIESFLKAFFEEENLKLRFRPAHFPFTEPSAEVDIACDRSGSELILGQGEEWLEVLGCGMVHPQVLRNCQIDPSQYQGFAFGMGIERLTMLKYGIKDLRAFYEPQREWLEHYGFSFIRGLSGEWRS
jgi:phenylalanyl-tRNA synthetase alpha chain